MADGFTAVMVRALLNFVICSLLFVLCGCEREAARQEIVLYTSVDEPYARAIVREFESTSGIHVVLVTDAEATKSVGLAERVRAEQNNPQCDVFWGNEPFHTINLAEEGLLQPYESPAGKDIPGQFKDPQHRWTSNGLRARVIALPGDVKEPASILDLTKAELKGRIAMARPSAGTTGGHVAALYVLWGDEKARTFFRDLRGNGVKLLGGNSAVAQAVAAGTVQAGLTDNDDVAAAQANDGKIHHVLPDQDSFGTLMVPTTVGMVKGAPHPDAAKKLIDYLLSPAVEEKLIEAKFALVSVRESAKVKAMAVNYAEVAKVMPRATREAIAILEGRE